MPFSLHNFGEDPIRMKKIIFVDDSPSNPRDILLAKHYPFVKSFIFKPITKEALESLIDDEVSDGEQDSA
jgi:hypothetical protein